MEICPESSFFKEQRAPELPPPAQVRALNLLAGHDNPSFDCPPPVTIQSLGLFVKYGGRVTVVEAKTQQMAHEQLKGHVPIPEVFGWAEDDGQGFIYMSLVDGLPLNQQWPRMKEGEKEAICLELKHMVSTWRNLEQVGDCAFVGSLGKRPLNEIYLRGHDGLAGPFEGENAVRQFHEACGIDINIGVAIKFTHADFVPVNILLSPGPKPKVTAIVDWGQAGWYPSYWEYCKAQRVTLDPDDFDEASQRDWREKYLPLIMDPVDLETCYYPWLLFVLSNGF